ncbi:MAG: AhpC/TSA family protein [Bacteroidales bacterium]|nr:AhpC/TSA family protein [Bacteroidales bacterium]
MMKKSVIARLWGAAAAVALTACVQATASGAYSVTAALGDNANEHKAYLVDFDTGARLDSTIVENGEARFAGELDAPVMVRLVLGGSRLGTFVLEPGDIAFSPASKEATGSPLNARLNAISDSLTAIEQRFRELPRDSVFEQRADSLAAIYTAVQTAAVNDNTDNPIGLYFFLQSAYELPNLEALNGELNRYPAFRASKRVEALAESFRAKEATSAGHKYLDFAIPHPENPDSLQRLSSFIGRDGKWTLVDFWASWCGPCIRETKVLKEILNEYGPKGLQVVGVAVWDEPENTRDAIARHQLPWEQIINAGTVPTDLYGISGIPCIILIDPQGTIVARDLQDDALRSAVEKALTPAPESAPEH